jgi:hypothetical protein
VCEAVCPVGLGIGRLADLVGARARRAGIPAPASRGLRLLPRDAMRTRLGLGADPLARRDAQREVRRVRLALAGRSGTARALRRAGDVVWTGEPVAVAPDGARVLAPFAGTVTSTRDAVTIRRLPA